MSPILRVSALALAAALAVAAPSHAQTAGKPLASVNGAPITEEDLKAALDDIGSAAPRGDDAQKRKYALEYLLDLKILAQAAEKQKMAEGSAFARKVVYLRDRALMEALMAKEAAGAVTDEKIAKFYEEAIKGLPTEEEARARHILVAEEAEAKKVYDRVKAGEDFAKIAGEVSKDPGSGKEGGDLGFFTKDRMVKEFAEAAFALKPGEVSQPVKSQFGYHVIKLEERRSKPHPPLAEVKEELSRYMTQKAQQDMIMKYRAEAKVEKSDEFTVKTDPAPTPAPAAPPAPPAKP